MDMKKAILEAIVNGIVIGALVAGVSLFSGQMSDIVIIRTSVAAMLMRFSFYMIENVEEVELGALGKYIGLEKKRKGSGQILSFLKGVHLGKLI